MFWSSGCSFLRAEGFFCSLDVLYWGLGIGKWQFFYLKKIIFWSCKFFPIFVHQSPGSGSNKYGSETLIREVSSLLNFPVHWVKQRAVRMQKVFKIIRVGLWAVSWRGWKRGECIFWEGGGQCICVLWQRECTVLCHSSIPGSVST